jgi:hypothetical protein
VLPWREIRWLAPGEGLSSCEVPLPLLEIALPPLEMALPPLEMALPLLETALPLLETALPLLDMALPPLEMPLPLLEMPLPLLEMTLPLLETALPPLEMALPPLEMALSELEMALQGLGQPNSPAPSALRVWVENPAGRSLDPGISSGTLRGACACGAFSSIGAQWTQHEILMRGSESAEIRFSSEKRRFGPTLTWLGSSFGLKSLHSAS